MTFPLTFPPTFPFLGGDVSKRTHFGNCETFRRFVQLRPWLIRNITVSLDKLLLVVKQLK